HQVSTTGTERSYSSTNYITLGAIIEAATGIPVEQHYRKRFFEPLHLRSMFLGGREPLWPGDTLASPHDNLSPFNPVFQLTGQPTFPNAYTNISAFPFTGIVSLAFTGGGLVCNASDLANWGNALFGGRATSWSTLQTMLHSISPTPDEDGLYLGYGIFRTTKISETDVFIGHNGRAPGYRSIMFYQPDKKMTIAILCNYYGADLYEVAKALYESMPEFSCGNKYKKEDKIVICYKGHSICVNRIAAALLLKRGAWLGGCEQQTPKPPNFDPKWHENVSNPGKSGLTIFPNPASNGTTVSFRLAKPGMVSASLYDINGKFVLSIFSGKTEKGILQQVKINTTNLPAGTYIVRLQTQEEVKQQKLVLRR
ncbi:MAG TPA: serine hydrolase, partial [Agriterribacter sp.]|nr:serine hydrolase [Agriterribacter sp.]